MKLHFFKMQAQGNDYLYFDFLQQDPPDLDFIELAKHICDRHYGVGADGIVLLLPAKDADAFMRIFNADGSEAEMCGSALRSVCGYLGLLYNKSRITVSTLSGIKEGLISQEDRRIKVRVDMGIPQILSTKLEISGIVGMHIDMGNPHYVVFSENLPGVRIAEMAGMVFHSGHFPKGVNIEYVRIDDRSRVTVQVWERGSGATLACGTGACAVGFAAYTQKLCEPHLQIDLPGGFVTTEYDESTRHIFLTGEVVHVFDGDYEW